MLLSTTTYIHSIVLQTTHCHKKRLGWKLCNCSTFFISPRDLKAIPPLYTLAARFDSLKSWLAQWAESIIGWQQNVFFLNKIQFRCINFKISFSRILPYFIVCFQFVQRMYSEYCCSLIVYLRSIRSFFISTVSLEKMMLSLSIYIHTHHHLNFNIF